MALGPLLARGRTAEIHAWGLNHVVKVYHPWMPRSAVELERRCTAAARAAGLPVPAVGEVVQLDGRVGLVLERVDGLSMMDRITGQQDHPMDSACRLAELHRALHQQPAPPGLPDQADRLESRIRRGSVLGPAEQEAALTALVRLDRGDRLCHGDFHPGNVLVADQGPVIIDWIDAASGSPAADLGRTVLLFEGAIATSQASEGMPALMRQYRDAYLEGYGADHGPAATWRAWMPVLAAARLDEQIEEQRDWLVCQVRQGLSLA
ncbi:MAG: phosphotransferase [Candidatus Latescibacterota bacterium]